MACARKGCGATRVHVATEPASWFAAGCVSMGCAQELLALPCCGARLARLPGEVPALAATRVGAAQVRAMLHVLAPCFPAPGPPQRSAAGGCCTHSLVPRGVGSLGPRGPRGPRPPATPRGGPVYLSWPHLASPSSAAARRSGSSGRSSRTCNGAARCKRGEEGSREVQVGGSGGGGAPEQTGCDCVPDRGLTRDLATPPLTVMDRLRGCSRRGAPPEARRGARSWAAGLFPLRISFFCDKERRVNIVAGRCGDGKSQMGLSVEFLACLWLLLPLLRYQVVQRLVEGRLCRHQVCLRTSVTRWAVGGTCGLRKWLDTRHRADEATKQARN